MQKFHGTKVLGTFAPEEQKFQAVTAKGTGPQDRRAGVDMDATPPTGGPVGHPPNPETLCDRSAQGSKL